MSTQVPRHRGLEGKPLISRADFNAEFLAEKAARPYDPALHKGLTDPYTGRKITSEAAYDRYLCVYVYSRMCDSQLSADYEQRLACNLAAINERHKEEINSLIAKHEMELKAQADSIPLVPPPLPRRRFSFFPLAALLVILTLFFWYIPGQRSAARQEGEAAGYKSGLTDGYADGAYAGYQDGQADGFKAGYAVGHASAPSGQTGTTSGGGGGNPDNFYTYNNPEQQQTEDNYVLNTNSKKFHKPTCSAVSRISPENYSTFDGTRYEMIARGYDACGICNP